MILYGRNMSPFVRRVAVWCALQGRDVERRKLTVAGDDFETLKGVNPLGRVPVLILDDGAALIETAAIIDWLEETAPEGRRLLARSGVERRDQLQQIAYANSTAEKAVALVYDKNRRPAELHWPDWQQRLAGQIRGGLRAMEEMAPADSWLGGDAPNGPDVALVATHDFVQATNPDLLEEGFPRLSALSERANATRPFAETQPET